MFNLITGAAPQVRAGQVIPIAVLSDRRAPQLPDVPTTAEVGLPDLTFGTWFGILVPKGTPAPIVAEVNRVANEAIADAEGRRRLEEAGLELYGGPPSRLADHLQREIRRHADIVRLSGARLD
jgi:tripartite-type tricarboxylate transporter receptor subunit TctC